VSISLFPYHRLPTQEGIVIKALEGRKQADVDKESPVYRARLAVSRLSATRSLLRLRRVILKVLPVVRNCPNGANVMALRGFGKRNFLGEPKFVISWRAKAICRNYRQP
jgi:hypothetical protein